MFANVAGNYWRHVLPKLIIFSDVPSIHPCGKAFSKSISSICKQRIDKRVERSVIMILSGSQGKE